MSVESNYAIVIATHGDWLTNLALVFQAIRSETKSNRILYAGVFPRLEKVPDSC